MIELKFFHTQKTKLVKKKMLSLLYSKKIESYRRSQIQKQYTVENKKLVSKLGYDYYVIVTEENLESCIKIIHKEFGDNIMIFKEKM